jgi:hypothetical protein
MQPDDRLVDVNTGGLPEENSTWSEIAPPVMWPDSGSGFEADAFSPAGSAQLEAQFIRGLSRQRFGRVAAWVFVGLFVLIPVVSFAVVYLVHR